jgi:hypothetical protein
LDDWSGLNGAADLDSPMQLRPSTYIGDAQKSYKHRSTGLTEKYDESSDFSYFAEEFWRHLMSTGMDTIAYLADPETGVMMSVILHHLRFTLTNATPLAEAQVQHYDSMDKSNNTAATERLLDSVSPELKKRIRNRIADQAPFPLVWLEFLSLTVSSSIDQFEQIK